MLRVGSHESDHGLPCSPSPAQTTSHSRLPFSVRRSLRYFACQSPSVHFLPTVERLYV